MTDVVKKYKEKISRVRPRNNQSDYVKTYLTEIG